jgi:Family of unknown function (DUF5675)
MNFVLTRDKFTAVETLGTIEVGGQTFQSIERPWVADSEHMGGAPGVSCVPEGTYVLVLHDTPKHPRTFALVNESLGVVHNPTPGLRSDVLIHPANWARELEGCIAPGRERVRDNGEWMVTHSADAMRAIHALVPWTEGHSIEIKRATPGVEHEP